MSDIFDLKLTESDDNTILDELVEDVSIPVPGGDKETPNSKPNDEHSITIPGGDKETPGKNSTEITAEDYNNALSALKKSFKESYEALAILENSTRVPNKEKSMEEIQEEFTENAIYESYITGPYFEKVDRSDKSEVVKIVKSLRSKIQSDAKEEGLRFTSPSSIIRIITGLGIAVGGSALAASSLLTGNPVAAVAGTAAASAVNTVASSLTLSGLKQMWTKRLWQVIGVIHIEEGNVKDKISQLNKKYKDELGEYKLLYSPALATLGELIANKFNWKNDKKVFFIVVDKKLPSELKEFQKAVEKDINSTKGKDSEESVKKESMEDDYSLDLTLEEQALLVE